MPRSKTFPLLAFLPLIVFSACAPSLKTSRVGLFEADSSGGILGDGSSQSYSRRALSEFAGKELKVTEFDIPVVKNDRVEFWVEYFSGRGRNTFARYIERLGRMRPLIEPILVESGLPKDLIYLAMIESGFSPKATSWAGAVGPWQFIPGTGKRYGLDQDWWHDERRDPVKSTIAAAKYLGRLYEEFEDWQLAAAAYNAGEGRIRWGIRKYNTRDYWELARRRAIRRETVDYVPKMMAAAIISKNTEVFGFDPEVVDVSWTETELVRLPNPESIYTLADETGTTRTLLRNLNPELKRWSTPPVSNYNVRMPSKVSADRLRVAIAEGRIGKFKSYARYQIRRGDTLSEIADRFGVGVQPIMRLNDLASARRIRPGQMLVLPVPSGATPSQSRAARQVAQVSPKLRNKPHVLYVVKKGDTLYDISRKYAVTVQQLKSWNQISKHRKIQPGQNLRLYVLNDRTNI